MIKNIIFDLGNVIINFNIKNIIKQFTESEFQYVYDQIFHAPEWTLLDLGEITFKEAMQIINERNNYKYDNITKNFLSELLKCLSINSDTIDIAKKLKNNGYNIFVLSNMPNEIFEYYKNHEFFSLCDGIIISAHEHIKKPDEKIFKILLNKYNLKAEETLFIDDDDTNRSYAVANKLGIQGRKVIPNSAEDIKKLLLEYNINL